LDVLVGKSMSNAKINIAYRTIKEKIIEGVLPPLSDISEDKLVKELEISRTPVREAIQRLYNEGFVYIYPRKGTIVTEVTQDLIQELYSMRELNELFIAKQACTLIPDDWLLEKKRAFQSPPKNLHREELRRYFIFHDMDLHSNLLKYCNNRFLQNIMGIVYDHMQRIRLKVSNPADNDKSIEEHIAILDAFLAHDSKKIEKAVTEHIKNSRIITSAGFRY
jgi:DNA-binding GntR family transcriptional regulator